MWYFWAKEKYNESDVRLWSDKDITEANHDFWESKIQYNQDKNWFKSWCVFHAWLGCISDLTMYRFSKKEIEDVWKLAKEKYLRQEWVWMYVVDWADCVVEYWNTLFPDKKLYKYIIDTGSNQELELMKKWYSIHNWFRWNATYSKDKNDDCELDEAKFWELTYWHSIRKVMDWDWNIRVVDNYFGSAKCNIYTLKQYQELVKNGIYFIKSYVYLYVNPPKMKDLPIHNAGTTPDEKEIVKAWENEMTKEKCKYNNYQDKYFITKMLIDLNNVR